MALWTVGLCLLDMLDFIVPGVSFVLFLNEIYYYINYYHITFLILSHLILHKGSAETDLFLIVYKQSYSKYLNTLNVCVLDIRFTL